MKNNNSIIPAEFISGIKEVSIDASSMIYLLKIGLLGSFAAEVRLVTTKPVYDEVQWPKLPVEIIEIDFEGLTNDQSLLALTEKRKNSILSEDLEILQYAEKSGWNYYNTLMMLNYLLLKGRLLESEYNKYLFRIVEISHYSKKILDYGEIVHAAVREYLS